MVNVYKNNSIHNSTFLDMENAHSLIKLNFSDDRVLFIADTDNHCIRVVYLDRNITKTYAGKCGEAGFKDGP